MSAPGGGSSVGPGLAATAGEGGGDDGVGGSEGAQAATTIARNNKRPSQFGLRGETTSP
jgi:hypothetical protein